MDMDCEKEKLLKNKLMILKKFYNICIEQQKNIIKAGHETSELLEMLKSGEDLKKCLQKSLKIIFLMSGDEVSYKIAMDVVNHR